MDVGNLTGHVIADTSNLDVNLTRAAAKVTSFSNHMQGKFAKNALTVKAFAKSVAVIGVAITAVVGISVVKMAQFDKAMRKSTAVSEVSSKQYVKMANLAEETSIRLNIAASKAAEGYYFLGSAGLEATEQLQAFVPVATFAKAGVIEIGQAAEFVVDTMKGFKIAFTKTREVTDVLTKGVTNSNMTVSQLGEAMGYVAGIAKTTNNTLLQTTAILGLFANVGIKGSIAGTALRKALLSLAAPTSEAKSILEQYVEVYDRNTGKLRAFTEILKDLIPALKDVGEEERNAALKAIFGVRALAGVVELFSLGSDKIDEFIGSLENAGGTAQSVADKQMAAFSEQLGIIGKQLDKTFRVIGKAAIDEMFGSVENLQAKIAEFNSDLTESNFKVTATMKGIASFLKNVSFVLKTAWNTILVISVNLVGQFHIVINTLELVAGVAIRVGRIIGVALAAAMVVANEALTQYGKRWDDFWNALFLLDFDSMREILSEPFMSIAEVTKKEFSAVSENFSTLKKETKQDLGEIQNSANQLMLTMNELWKSFTPPAAKLKSPQAKPNQLIDLGGSDEETATSTVWERLNKWKEEYLKGLPEVYEKSALVIDRVAQRWQTVGSAMQGMFSRGWKTTFDDVGNYFKDLVFKMMTDLALSGLLKILGSTAGGVGFGSLFSIFDPTPQAARGGAVSNFGQVPQIRIPGFANGVSGYQIPSNIPMDTMPVLVGGGEELDVRSRGQVGARDELLSQNNELIANLIEIVRSKPAISAKNVLTAMKKALVETGTNKRGVVLDPVTGSRIVETGNMIRGKR